MFSNHLTTINATKAVATVFLLLLGANSWAGPAKVPYPTTYPPLFTKAVFFENANLSNKDFQPLVGKWTGTLEYLNYGDDETRVQLPCKMSCSFIDNQLKTTIVFDETQNGKPIIHRTTYQLRKNNRRLKGAGKWKVVDLIDNGAEKKIIATRKGRDNNRKAEFRLTFQWDANQFTWTKDVRYKGETAYFNRNKHDFKR